MYFFFVSSNAYSRLQTSCTYIDVRAHVFCIEEYFAFFEEYFAKDACIRHTKFVEDDYFEDVFFRKEYFALSESIPNKERLPFKNEINFTKGVRVEFIENDYFELTINRDYTLLTISDIRDIYLNFKNKKSDIVFENLRSRNLLYRLLVEKIITKIRNGRTGLSGYRKHTKELHDEIYDLLLEVFEAKNGIIDRIHLKFDNRKWHELSHLVWDVNIALARSGCLNVLWNEVYEFLLDVYDKDVGGFHNFYYIFLEAERPFTNHQHLSPFDPKNLVDEYFAKFDPRFARMTVWNDRDFMFYMFWFRHGLKRSASGKNFKPLFINTREEVLGKQKLIPYYDDRVRIYDKTCSPAELAEKFDMDYDLNKKRDPSENINYFDKKKIKKNYEMAKRNSLYFRRTFIFQARIEDSLDRGFEKLTNIWRTCRNFIKFGINYLKNNSFHNFKDFTKKTSDEDYKVRSKTSKYFWNGYYVSEALFPNIIFLFPYNFSFFIFLKFFKHQVSFISVFQLPPTYNYNFSIQLKYGLSIYCQNEKEQLFFYYFHKFLNIFTYFLLFDFFFFIFIKNFIHFYFLILKNKNKTPNKLLVPVLKKKNFFFNIFFIQKFFFKKIRLKPFLKRYQISLLPILCQFNFFKSNIFLSMTRSNKMLIFLSNGIILNAFKRELSKSHRKSKLIKKIYFNYCVNFFKFFSTFPFFFIFRCVSVDSLFFF